MHIKYIKVFENFRLDGWFDVPLIDLWYLIVVPLPLYNFCGTWLEITKAITYVSVIMYLFIRGWHYLSGLSENSLIGEKFHFLCLHPPSRIYENLKTPHHITTFSPHLCWESQRFRKFREITNLLIATQTKGGTMFIFLVVSN